MQTTEQTLFFWLYLNPNLEFLMSLGPIPILVVVGGISWNLWALQEKLDDSQIAFHNICSQSFYYYNHWLFFLLWPRVVSASTMKTLEHCSGWCNKGSPLISTFFCCFSFHVDMDVDDEETDGSSFAMVVGRFWWKPFVNHALLNSTWTLQSLPTVFLWMTAM